MKWIQCMNAWTKEKTASTAIVQYIVYEHWAVMIPVMTNDCASCDTHVHHFSIKFQWMHFIRRSLCSSVLLNRRTFPRQSQWKYYYFIIIICHSKWCVSVELNLLLCFGCDENVGALFPIICVVGCLFRLHFSVHFQFERFRFVSSHFAFRWVKNQWWCCECVCCVHYPLVKNES